MTNIALKAVDSVTITMLADNVSDALLQNQGPAKRPPLGDATTLQQPAAFLEGGHVFDALRAELADGSVKAREIHIDASHRHVVITR